MINPFENVDAAFEPFFTDAYKITTKQGKTATLNTCKFDNATLEPLADGAMESEIHGISLAIRRDDWPWVRDNIARGDTVQNTRGKKYRVAEIIDDEAMGLLIQAREV